MKAYEQTDDHITASYEMEYAWNELRPQFTNIGLGMPNNSALTGSFNISFTGPGADQPIMAYMGDITRTNKDWGGPVTLGIRGAHNDPTNSDNMVTARNTDGVFAGEELFYAWAVPTNERLAKSSEWSAIGSATSFSSGNADSEIAFRFLDTGDSITRLKSFSYNGRHIGISDDNRGADIGSWILFPSFKIPLLIDSIGVETLTVRVSPYSFFNTSLTAPRSNSVNLEGTMNGLEEIHLLQAACLFTENGRLVQRIYGKSISDFTDKVLAVNVLGTYFVFDDVRRLLTVYIAARGNSRSVVPHDANSNYLALRLPDFVPGNFIASADMGFRILVESVTWRIRN
jgi:hypothetical protein